MKTIAPFSPNRFFFFFFLLSWEMKLFHHIINLKPFFSLQRNEIFSYCELISAFFLLRIRTLQITNHSKPLQLKWLNTAWSYYKLFPSFLQPPHELTGRACWIVGVIPDGRWVTSQLLNSWVEDEGDRVNKFDTINTSNKKSWSWMLPLDVFNWAELMQSAGQQVTEINWYQIFQLYSISSISILFVWAPGIRSSKHTS